MDEIKTAMIDGHMVSATLEVLRELLQPSTPSCPSTPDPVVKAPEVPARKPTCKIPTPPEFEKIGGTSRASRTKACIAALILLRAHGPIGSSDLFKRMKKYEAFDDCHRQQTGTDYGSALCKCGIAENVSKTSRAKWALRQNSSIHDGRDIERAISKFSDQEWREITRTQRLDGERGMIHATPYPPQKGEVW